MVHLKTPVYAVLGNHDSVRMVPAMSYGNNGANERTCRVGTGWRVGLRLASTILTTTAQTTWKR